jgi:hypothetical protein
MTKREAERQFREDILPRLSSNDKPARRQAWNDYVDSLQKNGQITERQAFDWDQPDFIKK